MLLGGLWHGASWNFVLWGAHPRRHAGVRARAGQGQRSTAACRARCASASRSSIVCLSWVFFRAKTLGQALAYLRSMFGARRTPTPGLGRRRRARSTRRTTPRCSCWRRSLVWGAAQHVGVHGSRSPRRARVGGMALLALVGPADVDADRQPVPLLPVLRCDMTRCTAPPRMPARAPRAAAGPTDPSHDERLRRGIIDTDVSRPRPRAIVGASSCSGSSRVPVGQAVLREARRGEDVAAARPVPARARRARTCASSRTISSRRRTRKAFVQPRVQALLTRFGRVGNKQGRRRPRRLALLHARASPTSAARASSTPEHHRGRASARRSTPASRRCRRRSAPGDPRVRARARRARHRAGAVPGAGQGDAAAARSCTGARRRRRAAEPAQPGLARASSAELRARGRRRVRPDAGRCSRRASRRASSRRTRTGRPPGWRRSPRELARVRRRARRRCRRCASARLLARGRAAASRASATSSTC